MLFWYFRISRSATVPGLNRFGLRVVSSAAVAVERRAPTGRVSVVLETLAKEKGTLDLFGTEGRRPPVLFRAVAVVRLVRWAVGLFAIEVERV